MTSNDIQGHWPELMQKAQAGDTAAYSRLLREITPALCRFLKSRYFSGDHIEDICQEILIGIHQARHTYLPDQPFANWMYGIARHKLIDALRRQIRVQNNEIADDTLVTFISDPANNAEEALSVKDL